MKIVLKTNIPNICKTFTTIIFLAKNVACVMMEDLTNRGIKPTTSQVRLVHFWTNVLYAFIDPDALDNHSTLL